MSDRKFENEPQFMEWNEDMVRRFDPEKFHDNPSALIRFVERSRVKAIVRMLELGEASFVLDAGCGAGNILEKIDAPCIGLDLSESLLLKARKRAKAKDGLICSNLERMPIADSTFDRVFCSEVIEHAPDPESIIKEIARVTKPGGLLVLTIPNEAIIRKVKRVFYVLKPGIFRKPESESESDIYKVPKDMSKEWHLHEFNIQEIKKLLTPYFKIDRIISIPMKFMPIRYLFRASKR